MTDDFNGFGLPAKLLQALARMQFTTPTPIQMQAIPLALTGRDILGSAQTGTGKTGAFGIPLIAKLIDNPQAAALVMTPTRELATQVMDALQQMIPVPTIRTALLIGGEPMPKQFRQLQGQPRLIVGTPGRINDHLQRGTLKLNNVRFMVLDETDRMLDMGFGIQIDRIVTHVPRERQTLMFSATLPAGIVKLSSKYMNDPERISVGSTTQASPKIRQELIHTSETEKYPQLLEHLKTNDGSVIIFVKTKYGTEKLADKLTRLNHNAEAIHGDLRQARRDRVIQSFRDKKFRILVATDLAARGLDVPHIEMVINYDLPQCPEDYIHRIGRTARAGAEGKAVNLLTPADGAKWNAIHRLMNPGSGRAVPEQQRSAGPKKYRGGAGRFNSKSRPFAKDGESSGAGHSYRKEGASAGASHHRKDGETGSRPHRKDGEAASSGHSYRKEGASAGASHHRKDGETGRRPHRKDGEAASSGHSYRKEGATGNASHHRKDGETGSRPHRKDGETSSRPHRKDGEAGNRPHRHEGGASSGQHRSKSSFKPRTTRAA